MAMLQASGSTGTVEVGTGITRHPPVAEKGDIVYMYCTQQGQPKGWIPAKVAAVAFSAKTASFRYCVTREEFDNRAAYYLLEDHHVVAPTAKVGDRFNTEISGEEFATVVITRVQIDESAGCFSYYYDVERNNDAYFGEDEMEEVIERRTKQE